jgi:hypothetical protein
MKNNMHLFWLHTFCILRQKYKYSVHFYQNILHQTPQFLQPCLATASSYEVYIEASALGQGIFHYFCSLANENILTYTVVATLFWTETVD